MSVRPSVHPYPSIYPFINPFIYPSVCHLCFSVSLPAVRPFVCLSIYLSTCQSIYIGLPIHLSINSSICPLSIRYKSVSLYFFLINCLPINQSINLFLSIYSYIQVAYIYLFIHTGIG